MGEPAFEIVQLSNIARPMKIKNLEEAHSERKMKPTLLVFQGFRTPGFIKEEVTATNGRSSIYTLETKIGRWDRYWNHGWRVRYDRRHICNSFYYPTHVALENGNIVEIGKRITPQDSKAIRSSYLGGGHHYYDQRENIEAPDLAWFLNHGKFKYPKSLDYFKEDINYFLEDQYYTRQAMGFPTKPYHIDTPGADNDTD